MMDRWRLMRPDCTNSMEKDLVGLKIDDGKEEA
ncbi:hypothetical protein Golob_005721 [Gossypium lobatum]|uniref:Uncharacterized protein n=1 Tax=Gossypium lobatum TaxID=34289 RepID=A0A7J8MUE5_9ROSI|nr:hypothetical protein [Gossypium lobatum]